MNPVTSEDSIEKATAMWRIANPGNESTQLDVETTLEWLVSQVEFERDKSREEQDKFCVDIFHALAKVNESLIRTQEEIAEGRRATAGVLKVIDEAVCRLYPGMKEKILEARGLHFAHNPKPPAEVVQMTAPMAAIGITERRIEDE